MTLKYSSSASFVEKGPSSGWVVLQPREQFGDCRAGGLQKAVLVLQT